MKMKIGENTPRNLASRLSAYTAVAAGAVAMTNTADAQVLFTDIPDQVITLTGGSITGFDLDLDGTPDIGFFGFAGSGSYAGTPYTYTAGYVLALDYLGQNAVVGNVSSLGGFSSATPNPLPAGITISGSSSLIDSSRQMLGLAFDGALALGNFASASCKFLGIKFFRAGGAVHYGYMVLDTDIKSNPPTVTVKALAWEQTANTPITLVGPITPVIGVTANVTGSAGNASDVQYAFNADCSDLSATSHRLIIVKSANAAAFDSTAAAGVGAANYTSVTPNGGPYSGSFTAGTLDSDGDAIAVGTLYDLFVYTTGSTNVLSDSDGFVLPVALTSSASNLALADIADNANGLDLNISFDKAADETFILQYSIIILKSAQADTASLSFLGSLPTAAYNNVAVSGNNVSLTLNAGSVDADGDAITAGVPYKAIVGTIGTPATGNAVLVTGPSNEVTLNYAALTDSATAIVAADVAENGDGRDLNVTFNKAANESKVLQYVLAVLPSAIADTATSAYLSTLPQGNFTTVQKTGSNLNHTYNAGSVDVLGDPITFGVAYKVLVITVGTAATNDAFKVSGPSNEVTLSDPTGIELINAIEGVELYSFEDAISLTVNNDAVVGERIRVINLVGQIVYTGTVKAGTQTIDMSGVNTGMYIAIIQHNGLVMRSKVFIGK